MSDQIPPTMGLFAEETGSTVVHLFYHLPEKLQPKTVRLGRRRLPAETSREYKLRIAAMQSPESEPEAA
jgi:hypothetical protein